MEVAYCQNIVDTYNELVKKSKKWFKPNGIEKQIEIFYPFYIQSKIMLESKAYRGVQNLSRQISSTYSTLICFCSSDSDYKSCISLLKGFAYITIEQDQHTLDCTENNETPSTRDNQI